MVVMCGGPSGDDAGHAPAPPELAVQRETQDTHRRLCLGPRLPSWASSFHSSPLPLRLAGPRLGGACGSGGSAVLGG